MEFTSKSYSAFGVGLGLSLMVVFSILNDALFLLAFPVLLAVFYGALYHPLFLFLSLAFMAPLSVNIEEYTDSLGLFIPTEPILFGLMILFLFYQLKRPFLPERIWSHPFILAIAVFLMWNLLSCMTSTHPLVSFKALLSKLWFLIPLLLFGTYFFKDILNVRRFLWLLSMGTFLVIAYTVINHSSYAFGEKESHWVMSPFYKDHTIYGAAVALVLSFPVALLFSKKQTPFSQFILIFLFIGILVGLYFSYTRAAWLSVFGAMILVSLIYFKVQIKWLLVSALCAAVLILYKWDSIQMELGRNKEEHTTEQFSERLQSAGNVSTDASNLERINRWTCAIEMFKERPIFGFGPGTYAFEYARFQAPENLTIISTNFGDLGNAHSEYLSALSETGLIGFIVFVVLVVVIFVRTIALVQKARTNNREIFILAIGILFSFSTYFIHAVLNNFLDTDKAAIPIFGMMAMVISLEWMLTANPERRV